MVATAPMLRRCIPMLASTFRPFVVVALAVLTAAGAAFAQSGNYGDGHAANHDWYRMLKTKSGWSCCNGDQGHGDCRPVQARERFDGQWEAFFNGSWQEIPPDAILRDDLDKKPLHPHICERAGFVYCFPRSGARPQRGRVIPRLPPPAEPF